MMHSGGAATTEPKKIIPFSCLAGEGLKAGLQDEMAQEAPELEALYESYFSKVYNYFFYRILHKEETEDLVSKVFLKIARSLSSYDPAKAQVSTWIMTIAANTLRDHYRTRKVTVSLDDEDAFYREPAVDFEEQYQSIASPERKELYAALSTLSPEERAMIYDKYYLGMTNREMAQQLHMNESTMGTLLMRARQKLRKVLEGEQDP